MEANIKSIKAAFDEYATDINGNFYMSIMRNKLIPSRIKTLLLNSRYGATGINRNHLDDKNDNKLIDSMEKCGLQYIDTDIAYDLSTKGDSIGSIIATGNQSEAVGIDAKITAIGKCNHPNKREANRDLLAAKKPIYNESDWTHCIFYRPMDGGECIFAGDCEHREEVLTCKE